MEAFIHQAVTHSPRALYRDVVSCIDMDCRVISVHGPILYIFAAVCILSPKLKHPEGLKPSFWSWQGELTLLLLSSVLERVCTRLGMCERKRLAKATTESSSRKFSTYCLEQPTRTSIPVARRPCPETAHTSPASVFCMRTFRPYDLYPIMCS